jgi:hypothetical protein
VNERPTSQAECRRHELLSRERCCVIFPAFIHFQVLGQFSRAAHPFPCRVTFFHNILSLQSYVGFFLDSNHVTGLSSGPLAILVAAEGRLVMKPLILTSLLLVCSFSAGISYSQDSASTRPSSATSPSVVAGSTKSVAPLPVVPRLIKFNGALRDLSGKPIAGPVDVTFSLYSDEAGGNALWFETQTVRADALGNYTVLLGAMTPAGVPMELFT